MCSRYAVPFLPCNHFHFFCILYSCLPNLCWMGIFYWYLLFRNAHTYEYTIRLANFSNILCHGFRGRSMANMRIIVQLQRGDVQSYPSSQIWFRCFQPIPEITHEVWRDDIGIRCAHFQPKKKRKMFIAHSDVCFFFLYLQSTEWWRWWWREKELWHMRKSESTPATHMPCQNGRKPHAHNKEKNKQHEFAFFLFCIFYYFIGWNF